MAGIEQLNHRALSAPAREEKLLPAAATNDSVEIIIDDSDDKEDG